MKILTAILVSVLALCQCAAQTKDDIGHTAKRKVSASNPGNWYSGIVSGYYLPIQKWKSEYTFGGGGSYFGGYQVNERLGLQLEWNNWLLSGSGRDTWDLKLVPEVKFNLIPSLIKFSPFLISGLGINYQLNQPGDSTSLNPVIPLGLGLQWNIHPHSRLLLEGFYYIILGTTTTQAIPILFGYSVEF